MQQIITAPAAPVWRNRLGAGVWAGLAGGAAEVAWIAIYRGLSGVGAADVARGITETVFPALAAAPYSVALGLFIHMVLALGLGLAAAVIVARALPGLVGSWAEFALIVAILVGVWCMNFLVILPIVNPAFVTIVPFGASLASKTLFGVTAALVFRRFARR